MGKKWHSNLNPTRMAVPNWWDSGVVGESFYRYYWTLWDEGRKDRQVVPPAYEGLLWVYWQRGMLPISGLWGTPGRSLVVRTVHPGQGPTFEARGRLRVWLPLPRWQLRVLEGWSVGRGERIHPTKMAAYLLEQQLYGARPEGYKANRVEEFPNAVGHVEAALNKDGVTLEVGLPKPWQEGTPYPLGEAALRWGRQVVSIGARMLVYGYLAQHGCGRSQLRQWGKAHRVKLDDRERDLVLGAYREFTRSVCKYKQMYEQESISWPIGECMNPSTTGAGSSYRRTRLIMPVRPLSLQHGI